MRMVICILLAVVVTVDLDTLNLMIIDIYIERESQENYKIYQTLVVLTLVFLIIKTFVLDIKDDKYSDNLYIRNIS